MPHPVSSIPNLGPKSEASYARAGITDAETLHELGADEAYKRLLLSGATPHFIPYYALVMGLQGRPWTDISASEKKALRKRFTAVKRAAGDALKRRAAKDAAPEDGPSEQLFQRRMEAALAELGVLPAE